MQPGEVAYSPHFLSLNYRSVLHHPAFRSSASEPAILLSPSQPLCHSTVITLHPMKLQVSLSVIYKGGK